MDYENRFWRSSEASPDSRAHTKLRVNWEVDRLSVGQWVKAVVDVYKLLFYC